MRVKGNTHASPSVVAADETKVVTFRRRRGADSRARRTRGAGVSSAVLHQDPLLLMFEVHRHDLTDAVGRHHLVRTGTGLAADRAAVAGGLSNGAAHVDVVGGGVGGNLENTAASDAARRLKVEGQATSLVEHS